MMMMMIMMTSSGIKQKKGDPAGDLPLNQRVEGASESLWRRAGVCMGRRERGARLQTTPARRNTRVRLLARHVVAMGSDPFAHLKT